MNSLERKPARGPLAPKGEIRTRTRCRSPVPSPDGGNGPGADISGHAIEAGTQIGWVSSTYVAQHRHEQTVRRIYGDAQVDLPVQPAPTRGTVIPRIQRGLRDAPGSNRTDQPNGDVFVLMPVIDVRVVDDRGRGHFRMGLRHSPCHGTANAAQRFKGPGGRQGGGSSLYVFQRDRAVWAARTDHREIDPEPFRLRTNGRCRPDRYAGRPRRLRRLFFDQVLGRADIADDTAGIVGRPFLEANQRRTDGDNISRLRQKLGNSPRRAARDLLDHRLVGFNGNQGLVGNHIVPGIDVPSDNFRLLQTLTQVGKREGRHGRSS